MFAVSASFLSLFGIVFAAETPQTPQTPQKSAASVAEAWLSVSTLDEMSVQTQWQLTCPFDQVTSSLAEQQREQADLVRQLSSHPDYPSWLESGRSRAVSTERVELAADGAAAKAHMKIVEGGKSRSLVVALQRVDSRWCVERGWAEQARLAGISEQANKQMALAREAIESWQYDVAEQHLHNAAALIEQLPKTSSASGLPGVGSTAQKALSRIQELHREQTEGWLGGRWTATVETDLMTDEEDVFVILEPVEVIAPSVVYPLSSSLILRCVDSEFEAYVMSPLRLDGSPPGTGRYRVASGPATAMAGTNGQRGISLFLDNPRAWATMLSNNDGQELLIEFSDHEQKATLVYDLTASKRAVEKTLQACE